jgi:hypothetical protein
VAADDDTLKECVGGSPVGTKGLELAFQCSM